MSDEIGDARAELLQRIGMAVRRQSALAVLMSAAIASRFGLDPRALECLDLILLRGSATAGELAAAAGLTSGSTTALIDRLERAGYVRREPDPKDRRRVVVTIQHESIAPIAAAYEPIRDRCFAVWGEFSDQELEVVERFLVRSVDLAETLVESIAGPDAGRTPSPRKNRT